MFLLGTPGKNYVDHNNSGPTWSRNPIRCGVVVIGLEGGRIVRRARLVEFH